MSEHPVLRVFISSPSDVRPERLIAERVVQRLAREFSYHFRIEAVLWEREPLVAGEHFQERIVPPHDTDIAVAILWSRLGVPLPEDRYRGAISGKPVTGTEWEFEDALASYREKRLPDLLLYRKKVEITGSLEDEAALRERLAQKRLVEDFMARWTRSADGSSFTAASWEFDSAAAFEELLEQHLRELIRRRLSGGEEGPAGIRWHQGSPFRGLESFELEHSAVFFGRTRARNELRELLARQEARGCAFVLVMGASGSGKSSLVKAGLLPDVKVPGMIGHVALCRHVILRPSDGNDLIQALAAALLQPTAVPELSALEYNVQSLAELLRAGASQASLPIRQGLAAAAKQAGLAERGEARLMLLVDQLEELFTRDTLSDTDRESFVAILEALAKSGLVWVVATMRSDFFDRLEKLPRLLKLSEGEARYLVAPPEPAEIAQMVVQPAREAGVRFEVDEKGGTSLDQKIQQAAARDAGALPLLSFLLDQLWQARDKDGWLTFAAYDALGGLEGSLGRRADEVFAALAPDVREALPEVLRALVTVGPDTAGAGRPATARTAPLSNFPKGTPARTLVDALLDPKARLLVAQSGERGEARVRVAHEALLTHWDLARKQVESDARDLQLRARLEQAADLWQEAPPRHRASLLLPAGLPLDEARDLVQRWKANLDASIVGYVAESRRAVRRRRLKLAASAVGAMASVPLLAALIWLALVWRGVKVVEQELVLVRIPQGSFMMGSPEQEPHRGPDEGPAHKVHVAAFELGRYEITQEQWKAVMLENPAQWPGANRPVEQVSWDEVQSFIRRMNRFGSRVYRLPTEAEWEYAARAGTTTAYPWGPELEPRGCEYANLLDRTFRESNPRDPISPQASQCSDGHTVTAPVGGRKPNGLGLFDMQGNVWEWVADDYHASYKGAPEDGTSWSNGAQRVQHVIRGGSFHSVPRRIRAAQRDREFADFRNGYIGFRLAASPAR